MNEAERRCSPRALLPFLLGGLLIVSCWAAGASAHPVELRSTSSAGNSSVVANFTGALDRLVTLVAAGGGALLALVWARVALSWFSNDVTKKVQAKDRARDALIGTLVFTAAISGLAWALAQWVVTGV
jgi:hypothetical protein